MGRTTYSMPTNVRLLEVGIETELFFVFESMAVYIDITGADVLLPDLSQHVQPSLDFIRYDDNSLKIHIEDGVDASTVDRVEIAWPNHINTNWFNIIPGVYNRQGLLPAYTVDGKTVSYKDLTDELRNRRNI